MEFLALLASTFFYFFSCCSTWLTFRKGQFHPGRFDLTAITLGVLCQSYFLLLRGQIEQACPIGTLPEILIFLSWAIGLFYIVIGSTYRVSLMGAFTAPLILALQTTALFLPRSLVSSKISSNPWIETHAAMSLIAFGSFGLACVAGLMFLIQKRQLKSQHPSPLFHHLPSILLLEKVTLRLLWLGFIFLSISFAAGFIAAPLVVDLKFYISLLVWGAYFLTLLGHQYHYLAMNRLAFLAIFIFLFALLILPGMRLFSHLLN
ncbi:MAG: cytochrome c biogenesis protein CcsA [Chthoniobacterales bacterium]|nr:cytochrome c biogenesis protein CcsA [Chthoniobacterales bacterium]